MASWFVLISGKIGLAIWVDLLAIYFGRAILMIASGHSLILKQSLDSLVIGLLGGEDLFVSVVMEPRLVPLAFASMEKRIFASPVTKQILVLPLIF